MMFYYLLYPISQEKIPSVMPYSQNCVRTATSALAASRLLSSTFRTLEGGNHDVRNVLLLNQV